MLNNGVVTIESAGETGDSVFIPAISVLGQEPAPVNTLVAVQTVFDGLGLILPIFSYAGTLRAVMQLFLAYPDNVFMLRGNHEHYVEIGGKVLAPVRPCEAMDSIKDLAPPEALDRLGYSNQDRIRSQKAGQ